MKKKSGLILISGAVFAAAIFLGGAYYFNQRQEPQPETTAHSGVTERESTEDSAATELTERTVTIEKMVEVYVDPALYDTNAVEETANDYVQVKQTTDPASEVLTKLHRGEWAAYLEDAGDYVKVRADSGKEGYIPKANAGSVTEVARRKKATALSQLSVVLDAGHGGIDTGAESPDGSVNEKTLTLQTAQAVGKLLSENGVDVTYTRNEDKLLALKDVAAFSRNENPDIFISLHYDNFDYPNGMQGFTTYYYYQDAEKFGTLVSNALAETLPLFNNDVRFGNYYVIRETYVPLSLLLELGYVNSDHDLAEITKNDYPDKVAKGILAALEAYVQQ